MGSVVGATVAYDKLDQPESKTRIQAEPRRA
jgi:hypothetical protein